LKGRSLPDNRSGPFRRIPDFRAVLKQYCCAERHNQAEWNTMATLSGRFRLFLLPAFPAHEMQSV
jgi:hypothetical protein